MLPEEKDVTASSTEQDVKETVSNDTTQDSSSLETSQGETQENLSAQMSDEELDDKGVSYKNRFHEMKRKYEQTIETIPQVIEQTISQKLSNINNTQNQQQPVNKEYSVQEIEEFARLNPEHRSWAESEKARLISKQAADEIERRFSERDKQRDIENKKVQTWNKLTSDFPDYFTNDTYGRKVWDEANPVVRQIAVLMQDPRLKQDPEGLMWATEIATARQLRFSQATQAKEKAQLKTKVKDLQKKTMVEGGQKSQSVSKDDLRDSIDELKKTGSKTAAKSAVGAYFKKMGYI